VPQRAVLLAAWPRELRVARQRAVLLAAWPREPRVEPLQAAELPLAVVPAAPQGLRAELPQAVPPVLRVEPRAGVTAEPPVVPARTPTMR